MLFRFARRIWRHHLFIIREILISVYFLWLEAQRGREAPIVRLLCHIMVLKIINTRHGFAFFVRGD